MRKRFSVEQIVAVVKQAKAGLAARLSLRIELARTLVEGGDFRFLAFWTCPCRARTSADEMSVHEDRVAVSGFALIRFVRLRPLPCRQDSMVLALLRANATGGFRKRVATKQVDVLGALGLVLESQIDLGMMPLSADRSDARREDAAVEIRAVIPDSALDFLILFAFSVVVDEIDAASGPPAVHGAWTSLRGRAIATLSRPAFD